MPGTTPGHHLHVTKAYFTVDLSALRGADILGAEVFTAETSVASCAKDRATQLWVTDPVTAPTWSHQPKQRTRLPGPGALGCPSSRVEWDGGAAVRDALAAGETELTLGMTMPNTKLVHPVFERAYADNLQITVTYSMPPNVPTALQVGQSSQKDCGAGPLYGHAMDAGLRATVSDPDGENLRAEFAVWPVDHPEQAYDVTTGYTSSGSPVGVGLPSSFVVDGQTYDWHVRALDDNDMSAWSPSCRFTIDDTSPAAAPTVTSTDYPSGQAAGGPGVPGAFTFDANGDTEVLGFRYGIDSDYIAADHPGGKATVTVTPERYGPDSLSVQGVDRAGNRSPETRYDYFVAVPNVDCEAPHNDYIGQPWNCTMTPIEDGVVSYSYTFDGGQPVTITPDTDGTAAFTVVPAHSGHMTVVVTETHADGTQATTQTLVYANPTLPELYLQDDPAVVGQPAHVSMYGLYGADLVAFRYSLDGGPELTADADSDQLAVVTITATTAGPHKLRVVGVTASGYPTDPAELDFTAVDGT